MEPTMTAALRISNANTTWVTAPIAHRATVYPVMRGCDDRAIRWWAHECDRASLRPWRHS